MKPIRLSTIGKIVWFFLIVIAVLLVFFIISLFKKVEPKKEKQEQSVESEKVINYTDSKNFTYDFENDQIEGDITIKESASYKLVGDDENHKIIIDSLDSVVKLILSNFNTELTSDLINVKNANKLIIELEDGSENTIGSSITLETENISNIIESKSDIEFIGNGKLSINSTSNFIDSKKSVNFKNGTLELNNITNGFRIDGDLTINSGTIYIKSLETAINSKGNISVLDGTLIIRGNNSIANEGLFVINKGKVFIASTEKIKKPNANSLQKSLILNFKELTKKMLFINDTSSFVLVYAGEMEYQHVLYSDDFKSKAYLLYETGKIAGDQTYGLYKVDEAEAGKELISPDLETNQFLVNNVVNVYNDIVKK